MAEENSASFAIPLTTTTRGWLAQRAFYHGSNPWPESSWISMFHGLLSSQKSTRNCVLAEHHHGHKSATHRSAGCVRQTKHSSDMVRREGLSVSNRPEMKKLTCQQPKHPAPCSAHGFRGKLINKSRHCNVISSSQAALAEL